MKDKTWYELLDYCREHADSIYVRYCLASGRWDSVPLSSVRFVEAIEMIDKWHKERRVPETR